MRIWSEGAKIRSVLAIVFIIVSLLTASPAYADAQSPPDQSKKMDSIRTLRAQRVAAFKAAFPKVAVQTNPVTGGPENLWGDLSKNQTKSEPLEATYEFFEQNKDLYGITNPREELKLRYPADKMVDFKQLYDGVEIYKSSIRAYFSPEGKLRGIMGGFVPNIDISTIPSVDSVSAIRIVKRDLKLPEDYEDKFWPEIEKLRGRSVKRPPPAKLAIYSDKGEHHLAWVVRLYVNETDNDWEYFVDAHTGAILDKLDWVADKRPQSVSPVKN